MRIRRRRQCTRCLLIKIYSAVGVIVPENVAQKFKKHPDVLDVLEDAYVDPVSKDYGGISLVNLLSFSHSKFSFSKVKLITCNVNKLSHSIGMVCSKKQGHRCK